MSILKKLLGKDKKNKASKEEAKKSFQNRTPRVQLLPLHNIVFFMTEPSWVSAILLANLSTTGVGFLRTPEQSWPELGTIVHGEFDFDGKKYPVKLRIAHITNLVVGCGFEGYSVELREMVARYLDLELAALTMTQVPTAMLQTEEDGTPHWMHGKNNCELFFVLNDAGEVVRFNLSFFANYIEGAKDGSIRYGHIVEDENAGKPKYKASSIIKWEREISPGTLEFALKFLENVPYLEPQQRSAILNRLKKK